MQLGLIYHQTKHADVALTKFAKWYDHVDKSEFLSFGTIVRTIQSHYLNIVNFFFSDKDMIKDGYSLLLPSGFTDYFEIIRVEESPKEVTIYLEEKLVLESDSKGSQLESKGFAPAVQAQDFPVRGRRLLLNIRRRRWTNKDANGKSGSIIAIVQGTRAEDVCKVLLKMPRRRRFQAREITLD